MHNQNDIYIFLGPTLSVDEARSILPDARYLPPVRCGEVLQLVRLKPKVILIIDGFFENTAAVWHKEILYAMSKGARVYGASSMGAIRASELSEFGMVGVGKIYQLFQSGEVKDDDEVTVLHKSDQHGYEAITDAMVDIRATVSSALLAGVLDKDCADQILLASKKLYYQERTIDKACRALLAKYPENQILESFYDWLKAGGYVNQKKIDAILALHEVKNREKSVKENENVPAFHGTSYFLSLKKQVQSKPFNILREWLPQPEKVVFYSRLLGDEYIYAKRLARLMDAVYSISNEIAIDENDDIFGFEVNNYDKAWMLANDISDTEMENFLYRMKVVCNTYNQAVSDKSKVNSYIKYFMIFSGDYEKLKMTSECSDASIVDQFNQKNKLRYLMFRSSAQLLATLDELADKKHLVLKDEDLSTKMTSFMKHQGITLSVEIEKWLDDRNLSRVEFGEFIQTLSRFDYLVKGNNLNALGGYDRTDDAFWLLDSLRVSGLYAEIKNVMCDSDLLSRSISQLQKIMLTKGIIYADQLDFYQGYEGFKKLLSELNLDETISVERESTEKI